MGVFSSSKKKTTAGFHNPAGYNPPPHSLDYQFPQMHFPRVPHQEASPMPEHAEHATSGGAVANLPQHTHPSHYPQYSNQHPNIVVNHYYIAGPPIQNASDMTVDKMKFGSGGSACMSKLRLGSMVNLATDLLPMNVSHFFDDEIPPWHAPGSTLLNQGAALYDQLSVKFDKVMTSIDCYQYEGNEADLFSYGPTLPVQTAAVANTDLITLPHAISKPWKKHEYSKSQPAGVITSLVSGHYFAKADLYANSKLPLDLPPVRLYLASYQLLSLAAKYSDRAYVQAQSAESHTHIGADWRSGTKAMVIKSVPMDDANTIVFAIRGTANFMDWAVNLDMAPTSPAGFLDDLGNLCHAGFLSVARKMVRPVAARLRQLLEEDPGRVSYSLLITGHSAGGAVASLLYSHMLASSPQASSELNLLTGCFRRIHCVTFGTPPVSLLPLKKPDRRELKNSMFYSFVNEGDPVVRADKEYVKSLIDLYSSSVPANVKMPYSSGGSKMPRKEASKSSLKSHKSSKSSKSHHGDSKSKTNHGGGDYQAKPVWRVPPSTLSNAGRLVVLRSGNPRAALTNKKTVDERLDEGVVAQFTSDEQLRGVIWGDPVCHVMKLYAGRIEALAIAAIMVDA